MNGNKLVSVIIPLYNAEKYIIKTLNSVLRQTYQNLEVIVVNNASTDNSIKLVEQVKDNRIKIINLDYNSGGPARPRNIGIDNAKGDFIAFLDSDDVWYKTKLEEQLKIFFQNKDIDIVYTLANTINEEDNNLGLFKNQNIYNKLRYFCNNLNILYLSNYININTVMMKKNKIRFTESDEIVALEDWMFWIDNLYYKKKVFLINKPLIDYRMVENSLSDRESDKMYRKAFVLYSILLKDKKISFPWFFLSIFINSLRILKKNI